MKPYWKMQQKCGDPQSLYFDAVSLSPISLPLFCLLRTCLHLKHYSGATAAVQQMEEFFHQPSIVYEERGGEESI